MLIVRFRSDALINNQGFQATWKASLFLNLKLYKLLKYNKQKKIF